MALFIYLFIFYIPPKNVARNLILNNNHNKVLHENNTCKSLAVNLSELYLYYLMASIQQMMAEILKIKCEENKLCSLFRDITYLVIH